MVISGIGGRHGVLDVHFTIEGGEACAPEKLGSNRKRWGKRCKREMGFSMAKGEKMGVSRGVQRRGKGQIGGVLSVLTGHLCGKCTRYRELTSRKK